MEEEKYLQSLIPASSNDMKQIESFAKSHHIPIMDPLGMNFLMQMIRIQQPGKILEIGTAIGYSALRMIEASPSSQVVTIERDGDRYKEALKNISSHHAQSQIKVLYGDALELREAVEASAPYDLLFIDAAKGKYESFFQLYTPLLADKGIIISDNVLFKGYVADDSKASKRLAKLAEKVRGYNEWLTSHPDFHTTIVPIGDGVAITTKR